MSGDELREREQRIILETSSAADPKVPTISGSKATLNDIRYRGSSKGTDDSLSSKYIDNKNTLHLRNNKNDKSENNGVQMKIINFYSRKR